MFLNIITPCSRPENLHQISKSINIPKENYRWIVVFDLNEFPDRNLIPENCEIYLHQNPQSVAGHSQRNFALSLIEQGHIYMNDDDTIFHSALWNEIKEMDFDFISFSQEEKDGSLRLLGDNIKVCNIDSHNFIFSKRLVENDTWDITLYEADGYFVEKMFNKTLQNPLFTNVFIPKVLSIYNSLR